MARVKKPELLASHEIRALKSNLHHIKPVIILGNKGLTDAVIQEIERALTDHELIKIRVHTESREQLSQMLSTICTRTNSTHIQTIGHIIAIYRKNPALTEK